MLYENIFELTSGDDKPIVKKRWLFINFSEILSGLFIIKKITVTLIMFFNKKKWLNLLNFESLFKLNKFLKLHKKNKKLFKYK